MSTRRHYGRDCLVRARLACDAHVSVSPCTLSARRVPDMCARSSTCPLSCAAVWRWSWVGCSAPPGRCCGVWIVKDGADSEGELSSRLKIEQRNADRPPLAENALVVERVDRGRLAILPKSGRCAVRAAWTSLSELSGTATLTRNEQRTSGQPKRGVLK